MSHGWGGPLPVPHSTVAFVLACPSFRSVFLTDDDDVRLGDFGLARFFDRAIASHPMTVHTGACCAAGCNAETSWPSRRVPTVPDPAPHFHAARLAADAGTDCYKAPEQFVGGRRDGRKGDVWSLGKCWRDSIVI